MTREQIESAISELQQLLDENEKREHVFQSYFDRHHVIFNIMGYTAIHSLKQLPLDDKNKARTNAEYLVPDFILQRPNGLFEILDLKTPQEKLIRAIPNRETFYAKMSEYISQVVNYSNYFDDRSNRELIQKNLGLDIQKNPDVVLIIGRDVNVDKRELHEHLRGQSKSISVFTYDDVLTMLRLHYTRLYGRTDDLEGAYIVLMMNIQKGSFSKRRYVFDGAVPSQSDRWSVFVDDKNIHLEVIDSDSVAHHIFGAIPEEFFLTNEPFLVSALFGNGEDVAFLQLRINSSIIAQLEISNGMRISKAIDFNAFVLGGDVYGQNTYGTTFGLCQVQVFVRVLNLEERKRIDDDAYKKWPSTTTGPYVHFIEGTFLATEKAHTMHSGITENPGPIHRNP